MSGLPSYRTSALENFIRTRLPICFSSSETDTIQCECYKTNLKLLAMRFWLKKWNKYFDVTYHYSEMRNDFAWIKFNFASWAIMSFTVRCQTPKMKAVTRIKRFHCFFSNPCNVTKPAGSTQFIRQKPSGSKNEVRELPVNYRKRLQLIQKLERKLSLFKRFSSNQKKIPGYIFLSLSGTAVNNVTVNKNTRLDS